MSARDPYSLLGLDSTAAPAQIRAAFRRMVRQRHPDTAEDATDDSALRDLIDAYRILIDPTASARYDASREDFLGIPNRHSNRGSAHRGPIGRHPSHGSDVSRLPWTGSRAGDGGLPVLWRTGGDDVTGSESCAVVALQAVSGARTVDPKRSLHRLRRIRGSGQPAEVLTPGGFPRAGGRAYGVARI